MSKSLKILTFIAVLGLYLQPTPGAAFCGKKCKARKAAEAEAAKEAKNKRDKEAQKEARLAEARAQSVVQSQSIRALLTEQSQRLNQVQVLISQGKLEEAHSLAKSILDEVKVKTGVHPKAKIQEEIPLSSNSLTSTDLNLPFRSLSNRQKESVILAVANYKAGLFLDVLNLAKRTRLHYLRAFYSLLKTREGKLLDRDIKKLRQDIMEVHSVPLLIIDPGLRDSYLIFDVDVADEDQQYAFNRELLKFLIELPEVGWTESDFDVELENNQLRVFNEHIEGIQGLDPVSLEVFTGKKRAPKSSAMVKGSLYPTSQPIPVLSDYVGNAETEYMALLLCTQDMYKRFGKSELNQQYTKDDYAWSKARYFCEIGPILPSCIFTHNNNFDFKISIKMCGGVEALQGWHSYNHYDYGK